MEKPVPFFFNIEKIFGSSGLKEQYIFQNGFIVSDWEISLNQIIRNLTYIFIKLRGEHK